jgi:peptide chain release factor 1
LLGVYRKYITTQGWQATIIDESTGEDGGFKNVVMEVKGDMVYSKLKWEAGVHRVQRVPATETQVSFINAAVAADTLFDVVPNL